MLTTAAVEILCSGVLFDMDGVLLDSTPAVARVWRWWAGRHGLPADEVVHRAHGRPSLATVRDYLPGAADHAAENLEIEQREIADVAGIQALPGARELLAALPLERWAIVTSCTLPLAEARFAAGGLPRPRWLVTADDVVAGKPAPDPYLQGAALLGCPPSECLVVEDVAAGVVAGKAAGARVLGLTTTVGAAELRAAGADWVASSLASVRLRAVHAGRLELGLAAGRGDTYS
ncbi:MAG TPA: HAD-IA family hydrolase [Terriglobales bacterium]|nr:HAD-IA family hydrolase [Terriglobales bacterium]